MSERFFKVKKDNKIYNEYFEWWNNIEPTKEKWKEFKNMVGIESTCFVPSKELYIVPTENDLIKFGRFLCKEEFKDGLRKFKKTSTIQKDWEKFVNANIKLISKPNIIMDFLFCGGRITTRLFHYEKNVYCSVNHYEYEDNYKVPEGYEEIKASEFYKIIEKIEEEAENSGRKDA